MTGSCDALTLSAPVLVLSLGGMGDLIGVFSISFFLLGVSIVNACKPAAVATQNALPCPIIHWHLSLEDL
jgi:hypothetical protein